LADGTEVPYDDLILAAGAVTNSYGVPGVERYAFGLKSLSDAMALRTHVLMRFEEADANPERLDDGVLTVVVAGGGPTGVELAGGMAELFARVVLLEATDRLLASFHPKLADDARSTLESVGVEVLLNSAVAEVRADEVVLSDGTVIPTHTMVWAAGVRAHPLAETLGVELTKGGRVVVGRDLSVPGHPEVHVIGDLAASLGPNGEALPQLAPVAMQGAHHVAKAIVARLHGQDDTTPFHYVDKGTMATIGRHSAVAQLPGGIRLRGSLGWLAWLGLHLVMLLGPRNKANVLVNWAWSYVTYDRASRIIPDRAAELVGMEGLSPDDHKP
jgi:NADH dehydrogenase